MTTSTGINVPALDVEIDGSTISDALDDALMSIEVDNNLYLPDVATIRFVLDAMEEPLTGIPDTNLKDSMSQGAQLTIKDGPSEIFDGEITSVGIEFNAVVPKGGLYAVLQASDRAHRLHRGCKTETFLQMSISDIAEKVINDAQLSPDVDSTSGVLAYVIQANQTDWEFLWQLADRTGYELYVEGNKVCFKEPRQTVGPPIDLHWGQELIQFRSRRSTAHQIPKVTVRAWDRDTKAVIIGQADAGEGMPEVSDTCPGASQASSAFGDASLVMVSYPMDTQDQAAAFAKSVSDSIAGEFIQAEGTTFDGMGGILPGVQVNIIGMGSYSGKYLVTSTAHILNRREGHRTKFRVGGRSPQVFPTRGNNGSNCSGGLAHVQGVVLGLVTNNDDPDGLCRVKIAFPWLGDQVETDWAPIAALGAGNNMGVQWLPAVGDQALVAFEHGDIHRPYVIGLLWSKTDLPPNTNSDVTGLDGKVDLVEIKSREGQSLTINDNPDDRSIGISGPGGESKITINHDSELIEISSNKDITISGSSGKITVEGQDLEIKSSGNLVIDASANLDIKAGANLSLKGGAQADLEGQITSVKGAQTTVEGSAMAEIKAPLVKIN